jgi:4-hydroxy-3-polyprenylbenzoate decarboxylase
MEKLSIILAITGASGSLYAKMLMSEILMHKDQVKEAVVIFSKTALSVWKHEIGSLPRIPEIFKQYDPEDFYAPVASGSSDFTSMIICPCSMGTAGRIANGFSNDLITRSADVMLKEKRTLILVPRETPYNLIHVKNMESLILSGAIILPASPSFYSNPQDINSLIKTVTDRILVHSGFKTSHYTWGMNPVRP